MSFLSLNNGGTQVNQGYANRNRLDARKSSAPSNVPGLSEGDLSNSWGRLADIFYDSNLFQPQNAVIQYIYDDTSGTCIPCNPQISVEGMNAIASRCYGINPSQRTVYRTADELKEKWATMKTALSSVNEKFKVIS